MSVVFKDGATVLFQGDSITDASRSRQDASNMGHGYAAMASAWFSAEFPEKRVRFINRGISGNRAADLVHRWEEDCIALKPTWVSILIGVNDTWRGFDRNDPTSVESFEASYRTILEATNKTLRAGIIMLEPFLLPIPDNRRQWRADLDPKLHAVRALAREFGARLVPTDGVFAAAAARREMEFWAPDGIHPTPAGHALIAQAWLRTVGAIR